MHLRPESRGALLALLAMALVLRVGFLVGAVGSDAPLRGDEVDYQHHAADLALGKGFVSNDGQPSAARPPLLPLLLGGLYRIFGVHVAVGRALEIALGVLIVGLTYLLAARFFSRRVALVAAGLAALNPYLIFISSYILTENLYMVLLLALLLVLERARRRLFDLGDMAVAGVLLGLVSLTRPYGVIFAAVVLLAIALIAPVALPARAMRGFVFLAALCLTILPWAARNHARLGEWVIFTTHGGITFYQSNNLLVVEEPSMRGGVAPREMLPGWDKLEAAGETERDREAWQLARSFLRDNRRLVPRLVGYRFLRFWRLRSHAPSSGVKGGWWWNKGKVVGRLASTFDAGIVYSIVVIPSFLVGLVVTARQWRRLYSFYGVVLVHLAIGLAFYGSLRARLPVELIMAILGAAGLAFLAARLRGLRAAAGRAESATGGLG